MFIHVEYTITGMRTYLPRSFLPLSPKSLGTQFAKEIVFVFASLFEKAIALVDITGYGLSLIGFSIFD